MEIRSSIDIGTHSLRILVADVSVTPPAAVRAGIEITRLGEGLDRTGEISSAAIERMLLAMERFAGVAAEHGVRPRVFATAALREARNGRDVASLIRARTGFDVEIIPAGMEAWITFRGAALSGMIELDDMVLDIGGGSTEFMTCGCPACEAGPEDLVAVSARLGSVRHTERHLVNDPPSAREIAALRADVRAEVERSVAGRRPKRLHGVAGSVTQLAALELRMAEYDASRINGFSLERGIVERWIDVFLGMKAEERKSLVGMVPGRATTVVAGTVILHETLCALDLPSVNVLDYDSLWGALSVSL